MTTWWLCLGAVLAQEPEATEVPAAAPPAEAEAAAEQPALPDEDPATEEPAAPVPWSPPVDPVLRTAEGLPILGPWPDDHEPEGPVHRAWPLVDVGSGEVLQAGRPYGQAEGQLGPRPAPEIVFEPDPGLPPGIIAALQGPPAGEPEPAEAPDATADAPHSPPRPGPWLPRVPPGSPLLALFWFLVTLVTTAFARSAPAMVANLRGGGALPALLRAGGLAARVVAVVAALLTVLFVLPHGARGLIPWVLVGVALAAGLSAWGLFRDVLALLVLTLERKLGPGRQVRVGGLAGEVVSQSPRAVTLRTTGGSLVTVPNWDFVSQAVHLDVDPRAAVEVRLRVPPHAPRERVHRVLEELVLLSPYAVSRGRPRVRPDPDDPAAWWVEARLLDAKWARDFERTLVELAAERLES